MRKPLDALKKRLRPPSASMVLAAGAVFIALGGGAYAATQINGQNIQNGTIGQAKFNHADPDEAQPYGRQELGHHHPKHDRVAVADLRSGPYGSFGVTGAAAKPPSRHRQSRDPGVRQRAQRRHAPGEGLLRQRGRLLR